MILFFASLALAETLEGFVFEDSGRPLSGVQVQAGGRSSTTDREGNFQLDLPPGVHLVTLTPREGTPISVPEVPIAPGRSTELLVALGAGPPKISVEAPVLAEERRVAEGPPGVLIGRAKDAGSGAPLAGVRVYVRGYPADTTTDADGNFRLELPSGPWDLSAIKAGYVTVAASTRVEPEAGAPLEFRLERAGLELAELTIRAPRIEGGTASVLDERQEAAAVSDVLGAEQMSRSGDGDAAAALKRVTGLTVVGGRYVYVRGLGDRYSATLLNGSMLPSPEPEKRVVPLDLFPTSLLESVVVQKTFSPDRPAEFGGGVVEVRTRGIPEGPVLQLSVSGSFAPGTTGQTVAFGAVGPRDWLGFGQEFRALPGELAAASEKEAIKSAGMFSDGGYSADELEHFGELIPNRWGLEDRTLPPDFGATLSAGHRIRLGELELGALAGLVYQNGWSIEDGRRTVYSSTGENQLEAKRITEFTEVEDRIRVGGALTVGARWREALRVDSTTLLMRSSRGGAEVFTANDPTGSNDSQSTRISWEEQQLLFQQVAGELNVGPVFAEARYALGLAGREAPDGREYTYLLTESGLVISQRGSWSEILYESLTDRTDNVSGVVGVKVRDARLSVGAEQVKRRRASTSRRFGYQFQGSDGIDLAAPIDEIISPENIGREDDGDLGYLELEENTTNSDDYRANQRLQAGFVMGDVPWTPRLRTMAGVRVERSTQTVSTFELFDTNLEPVNATLSTSDWLPAATVSLGLGPESAPDTQLLRLGYGRTLSRPELRELSQVSYYDYRSGRLLYGNPDLQRALIDNVDLRWEWYPRPGEALSAGAFYKRFQDPIESVVAVSAVSGSVGTFANATSASNLGIELDFRQRLDRVHPVVRDVYVSANSSLIRSRVDLSETEGNQTSDERPLQGQSPWVINGAIGYENPDYRFDTSLLYNVYGPRIVEVGTSGIPDTYEEPVHRVDLVLSKGLGPRWNLKFKASNILDWPSQETTGGRVSEETYGGRKFGVSIGCKVF